MEDWQVSYITENLPKLINLTEFNCNVRVVLLAERVLSAADVDDVEAKQFGKIEKSYHYLQKHMSRKAAYEKLTKTLFENGQSGAARLLMEGFIKHGENRPFTACRISISYDSFQDADIMVHGRLQKIKEIFQSVDIKAVEQIFRDGISEMDYYYLFIRTEQTFELIRNTMPPEPSYYVPRYLSNRIKIDPKVFKEDCVDIFVFKEIERFHLSDIARPHFTASSNSQRDELTSRFILLDYDEDFSDLLEVAKVPVHLFKYESDRDLFILEYTSDHSGILKKFLADNVRVYMSEEEFIQQETNSITLTKHNGICICDTPGMGKTLLLARIARRIIAKSPTKIVAFVPLCRLLEHISHPLLTVSPNSADVLLSILEFISPIKKHAKMLLDLVRQSLIGLYLFLDGFDEIRSADIEWSKKVIKTITGSFPKIKIYVTSRSHMRQELESTLGVVSYDILPFTQKNQINFLQNFWSLKFPQCKSKDLVDFAARCLEMLKDTLSEEDHEITGIPLLCQLIAEAYANEAHNSSTSARQNVQFKSRTIIEIYKNFIDERIKAAVSHLNSEEEIILSHEHTITQNKIKRFLLWHAMKLLFPQEIVHNLDNLENVDMSDADITYKTGILQQCNVGQFVTIEFVHRTFAEFIVAEYVLDKLLTNFNTSGSETMSKFVFNTILETKDDNENIEEYGEGIDLFYYDSDPNSYFKNPVIVYFLNCLNEQLAQTILNLFYFHVDNFCQIVSPTRLLVLLKSSCEQNLTHIFSLFVRILKKCNIEEIKKYKTFFDQETCLELVTEVIRRSKSKMIYDCFDLCTLLLQDDVLKIFCTNPIVSSEHQDTLLQIAVENGNYEAVEYLYTKCPLQNQELLERCIQNTYVQSSEIIQRKIDIVKFLLHHDLHLLKESPNIFVTSPINLELLKLVIPYRTSLLNNTKKHRSWNTPINCVMYASSYMYPDHYDDFVRFILFDCQESSLLKHHNSWGYPLEFIMTYAPLLPTTFDMLISTIQKNERGLPSGENLLLAAIRGNNLHTSRQLLACGFEYKHTDDNHQSLLHIAAKHRSPDLMKCLITLGLDVNCFDKHLNSPLHLCTSLCALSYLAHSGGIMELQNADGDTAAHKILQTCLNVDVNDKMQLLSSQSTAGSIFNIKNKQGNSALHILFRDVSNIQVETLELILNKSKIDINGVNNDKVSPTMLAVQWCGLDLIKCLVQFGADILATDLHGKCLLHYSAQNQHTDTTKYLLSFGLQVNQPDTKGNTPLHYCSTLDAVANFIDTGANLLAQNDEGDTFVEIFQRFQSYDEKKLLKLLIKNEKALEVFKIIKFKISPDPSIASATLTKYMVRYITQCPHIRLLINQKDVNGDNLLLLEAKFNRLANVRQLIKHGADINATNNEGYNLVHISSLNDNIQFVLYSINELNMDINTRDKCGNSPILLAARKSDSDTIKAMINYGADINAINNKGHNLVHIASLNENINVLKHSIINLTMDVNTRDKSGNSPILLAAKKSKLTSFRVMIALRADPSLKNYKSQGIFHFAASNCDQELLHYSLQKLKLKFDEPDKNGNTPILLAAENNNIQAIRSFKDNGANTRQTNLKGQTIIHVAALHENMELLKECIGMEMDVQQKDKFGESSSLIVARQYEMNEVLHVFRLLYYPSYFRSSNSAYLVITIQSNKVEDAALLLAVAFTDVSTVRKLIERGANHNCTDSSGRNIFHVAAEYTRPEQVKLCLELGLNPNQKGQFSASPKDILQGKLHIRNQDKNILKCLCEIEAEIKKSRLKYILT